MRVHVVSDVHGSVEALARAGDGADALVVLGDLIDFVDYADPTAGSSAARSAPRSARSSDGCAPAAHPASWSGSSPTPGPGSRTRPRSSSRPSVSSTTSCSPRSPRRPRPSPATSTCLGPGPSTPGPGSACRRAGGGDRRAAVRVRRRGPAAAGPDAARRRRVDALRAGRQEYAATVRGLTAVDVLCSHAPPAVPELAFDVVTRRPEASAPALLERGPAGPAARGAVRARPPAAGRPGAGRPHRVRQRGALPGDRPALRAALVSVAPTGPPVACRHGRRDVLLDHHRRRPDRVMEVIADFPAYPEWADQVKSVEVLDTDAGGRPERVRFPMDAGPIKDTYTFDYTWAPDGRSVSWTWSRARSRRPRTGPTCSSGTPEQTTVTYSLAVDLNIPMIGMLRRKAEKVIIDTALKGLKRRVESAPPASPGELHAVLAAATLGHALAPRADGAVHGQGRGRKTTLAAATAAQLAGRAARRWSSPPTPRTRWGRAGGRPAGRADRAGRRRAVRRPHRHPGPARQCLGSAAGSTCGRCSPGPGSRSWWRTS